METCSVSDLELPTEPDTSVTHDFVFGVGIYLAFTGPQSTCLYDNALVHLDDSGNVLTAEENQFDWNDQTKTLDLQNFKSD